jgi:NAD/NADP transhydrogenase alpha subunit
MAGANVTGGYVVTGRMLKMFRRKAPEPELVSADGHPELVSANGHKGLRGLADRIGVGRAQS